MNTKTAPSRCASCTNRKSGRTHNCTKLTAVARKPIISTPSARVCLQKLSTPHPRSLLSIPPLQSKRTHLVHSPTKSHPLLTLITQRRDSNPSLPRQTNEAFSVHPTPHSLSARGRGLPTPALPPHSTAQPPHPSIHPQPAPPFPHPPTFPLFPSH